MNIVIDTNVFVSGLFFGGTPYRILKAWGAGQCALFVTNEILVEYERVIRELSCKKPQFHPDAALIHIRKNARLIKPVRLPDQVCTDADDDKFIACALSAEAIVITGDKALLRTAGYKGSVVLSPAAFELKYLR